MSKLTTDRCIDIYVEISPQLSDLIDNLKSDNEFLEIMNEFKSKPVSNKDFALKLSPLLLKNYRDIIYNIISILFEKDVETIKNQSVFITLNELKEILSDEELLNFTKSTID